MITRTPWCPSDGLLPTRRWVRGEAFGAPDIAAIYTQFVRRWRRVLKFTVSGLVGSGDRFPVNCSCELIRQGALDSTPCNISFLSRKVQEVNLRTGRRGASSFRGKRERNTCTNSTPLHSLAPEQLNKSVSRGVGFRAVLDPFGIVGTLSCVTPSRGNGCFLNSVFQTCSHTATSDPHRHFGSTADPKPHVSTWPNSRQSQHGVQRT